MKGEDVTEYGLDDKEQDYGLIKKCFGRKWALPQGNHGAVVGRQQSKGYCHKTLQSYEVLRFASLWTLSLVVRGSSVLSEGRLPKMIV